MKTIDKKEYLNRLSKKRLFHSKGCAEICRDLASEINIDPDTAYYCGLYHDIFRELPDDEYHMLIEKYPNLPKEFSDLGLSISHGPLAAYFLKEKENISEDIFETIYYHTTGKNNMDILLQIMLIADFSEPSRENSDSIKIRRLLTSEKITKKNISRIALRVLQYKLKYLKIKNKFIFHYTMEAMDFLSKNLKDG